jgi:hypothetical protein
MFLVKLLNPPSRRVFLFTPLYVADWRSQRLMPSAQLSAAFDSKVAGAGKRSLTNA